MIILTKDIDIESRNTCNTIDKAKKNAKNGAIYGGLFGLTLGMGSGWAEAAMWGPWGHGLRFLIPLRGTVGLAVGASAGALLCTNFGLFNAMRKNQPCQANIIPDKTNEQPKKSLFKN